jgi:hypothetical protein
MDQCDDVPSRIPWDGSIDMVVPSCLIDECRICTETYKELGPDGPAEELILPTRMDEQPAHRVFDIEA